MRDLPTTDHHENSQGPYQESDRLIRLLLIDDDQEEYFLTRKKVQQMPGSFALTWIDDFDKALEQLLSDPPDVGLVDYHLEARTGLDLIEICKQQGLNIPFILLTGQNSLDLDRRALQTGADDFLPKAELTPSSLERAISHSLERRKNTMALVESEANFRDLAKRSSATLHNVGNILSTMAVTVNRMRDLLKESRLKNFSKLITLIEANLDDFPNFVRENAKGKLIPSYLLELNQVLHEEQKSFGEETESYLRNIRLMEDVINNQQFSAKALFGEGTVSLLRVVEDAILASLETLTEKKISVYKFFQTSPHTKGSRSKLTHVFINLLKNAIEAMDGVEKREIHILVETVQSQIQVRFQDTGKGIPPWYIDHLFEHGFTTKQDGHGFGLEFCVKTVNEMGGSLTLEGTEEGRGSTFLMTLPEWQTH